jgi:hypothetical protein
MKYRRAHATFHFPTISLQPRDNPRDLFRRRRERTDPGIQGLHMVLHEVSRPIRSLERSDRIGALFENQCFRGELCDERVPGRQEVPPGSSQATPSDQRHAEGLRHAEELNYR